MNVYFSTINELKYLTPTNYPSVNTAITSSITSQLHETNGNARFWKVTDYVLQKIAQKDKFFSAKQVCKQNTQLSNPTAIKYAHSDL